MKTARRLGMGIAVAAFSAAAPVLAQQWSDRGPVLGGRLTAILSSNGGRDLLVASPGGGVWRSTDSGRHWAFPANIGAGDLTFVHLEWDLENPRRLFGQTWNGLYASTDLAESWTALVNPGGTPAPLGPEQATITDPRPFAQARLTPSGRVVLQANPCSGLMYSFDGTAFTQHWPFREESKNPDNCVGTIVADPVSHRVYFSTLGRGGLPHVYRSDCGAQTWTRGTPCLTWVPANRGLPTNTVVAAMVSVSEPGSPDHLVALVTQSTSMLTFATSDGLTWELQSKQDRSWSQRVLLHPAPGPELFAGYVGFAYSPDLGRTWQPVQLPNGHPDYRAAAFDIRAGKMWTVNDGSASGPEANIARWDWRPGHAPTAGVDLGHDGLSVWQMYYAAVVAIRGGGRRVFAGSQDNGSLCADDVDGRSWTVRGGAPTGGDAFVFQSAPSNPNRAYAWANTPDHFTRTSNAVSAPTCAAVAWTEVKPTNVPANASLVGPYYWSRHNMAIDPTNADHVYFALNSGLGVSTDAGAAQVEVVHRELPQRYRASAVHSDGRAVYVGTTDHGVYRSTDDGQTWTPFGLNDHGPSIVTAIAGGTGRSPILWMTTTDGVYSRGPADGAWTKTIDLPGYTASDVTVDPVCASRAYVAFGYVAMRGEHRGGVQMTSDGGRTWTSVTSGQTIHDVPITAVQVDAQAPGRLYTATFGRGFWVLDWGPALPRCGARAGTP